MVGVRGCGGFTLAELLVATAVTIVALGLAVSLLHPVTAAFQSLPEASDAQQRLRVAVHTLSDEIAGAGAGPVSGWAARAVPAWPAVLPCRSAGEPLGTRPDGCAQPDAITLMTTPLAAPQAVLADDLAAADGPFRLAALSACALSHPACRFHADARVLIADGTGAWDVAPLSAVSADGFSLEHAGAPVGRVYRAGALVGEVASSSYNRRLDLVTGVSQLRRSVDGSADLPVVDHVTDLRFEYFGRADPPAVFDDGDALRRRTSYGPLPPPGGIDDTLDAWPPGESCHFIRAGGQAMPRQAALPAGPDGLARLPLELLADGPWCPDAASVNRYDADLLRIRLVRIVLRIQAQSPAVRGHDAWLFAQPGGARESSRLVPDLEVRTDAALRNR
jgi:type II secretory pathway pseudopilin PulG